MVKPFVVNSAFATLCISSDLRISSEGFAADEGKRTFSDLAPVLKRRPKANLAASTVLYRMYRSFARPSDAGLFKERHIRHDLTVLAPLELGTEPNKTLGHYHPIASGGLSYPEVYHVLFGKAAYLLQKEENGKITDFVKVEARAGEALLIPPNYGHVTANIGEEPLVMANLVSDGFSSAYEPYARMGGATYYLINDGSLVANPRYGALPEPRTARPNFRVSKDLYSDFKSCPGCFAYLNQPARLGGLGKI